MYNDFSKKLDQLLRDYLAKPTEANWKQISDFTTAELADERGTRIRVVKMKENVDCTLQCPTCSLAQILSDSMATDAQQIPRCPYVALINPKQWVEDADEKASRINFVIKFLAGLAEPPA